MSVANDQEQGGVQLLKDAIRINRMKVSERLAPEIDEWVVSEEAAQMDSPHVVMRSIPLGVYGDEFVSASDNCYLTLWMTLSIFPGEPSQLRIGLSPTRPEDENIFSLGSPQTRTSNDCSFGVWVVERCNLMLSRFYPRLQDEYMNINWLRKGQFKQKNELRRRMYRNNLRNLTSH